MADLGQHKPETGGSHGLLHRQNGTSNRSNSALARWLNTLRCPVAIGKNGHLFFGSVDFKGKPSENKKEKRAPLGNWATVLCSSERNMVNMEAESGTPRVSVSILCLQGTQASECGRSCLGKPTERPANFSWSSEGSPRYAKNLNRYSKLNPGHRFSLTSLSKGSKAC